MIEEYKFIQLINGIENLPKELLITTRFYIEYMTMVQIKII